MGPLRGGEAFGQSGCPSSNVLSLPLLLYKVAGEVVADSDLEASVPGNLSELGSSMEGTYKAKGRATLLE